MTDAAPKDAKASIEAGASLPAGGAWMGTIYVLPCKDAKAHFDMQVDIEVAQYAEVDIDITYTNALCFGVYPVYVTTPADCDATCFNVEWPDDSYAMSDVAGMQVNAYLLAYSRGIIKSEPHLHELFLSITDYFAQPLSERSGLKMAKVLQQCHEFGRMFAQHLATQPAPGGAEAFAALEPLFPKENIVWLDYIKIDLAKCDAAKHLAELERGVQQPGCDPKYTNGLIYGILPVFVPNLVDARTTCFAWACSSEVSTAITNLTAIQQTYFKYLCLVPESVQNAQDKQYIDSLRNYTLNPFDGAPFWAASLNAVDLQPPAPQINELCVRRYGHLFPTLSN